MFSRKSSVELRLKGSHIAIFLCLIFNVLLIICFALTQSLNIAIAHIDGTYQTASALYRLAEGQIPGKDFFPYLGLGVNYFLYPFFLITGSNVAASTFAAHLTVAFSFIFILTFLSFLITKNFSFSVIIASASLAFMLFIYPNVIDHVPQTLASRFTPGTSLRPIRSFVPYIVASISYTLIKLKIKPLLICGFIGFLSGLTFFWSNDFGIPSSFFLICFAISYLISSGRLSIQTTLITLVGLFVGLVTITRGYLISIIQYNFRDVRHDQYWYFGPWDANSRVLSLFELPERFLQTTGFWSVVFLILIGLTIYRANLERITLVFIGTCLLAGGLVASIGGTFSFIYLSHFVFWCQLVAGIAVAFYLATFGRALLKRRVWYPTLFLNPYLAFIPPVILFCFLLNYSVDYVHLKKAAKQDSARFYVSELGGYLPTAWRNHIEIARSNTEKTFLEEYWGLWGAVVKRNGSAPVDSVIHALGKKRESFTQAIATLPDFIITTRFSSSPNWQPWNLSENYWFYKLVLENYQPAQSSPTTILWEKPNTTDLPIPSKGWRKVECQINSEDYASFILPGAKPNFYEVTLNYQFKSDSSRSLVLARTNIPHALDPEGYLSIDPKGSKVQFPVAIPIGWDKTFDFKFVTPKNSNTSIAISGCSAQLIPLENDEVLNRAFSVGSRTSVDVTDKLWVKGFSKNTPSFIVPNTIANQNYFQQGKNIQFRRKESRKIIKTETFEVPDSRPQQSYIKVFFEGSPLNGRRFGYPREFILK